MFQTHAGRNPDWLIARSRLLLFSTMLVMAVTDDEAFGFVVEPDDVLLGYFSYLAFAQILILMTSWWLNYRLRLAAFVLDLGLYMGLMFVVEPMQSGYFASTVAMLAFLIVSAAVQWGWRGALKTAILLNVICLAMIAVMWAGEMEMPAGSLLRRQTFELLISIFLVWGASFAQMRWLKHLDISLLASADTILERQLDFALDGAGSKAGALCWTAHDLSVCDTASKGLSTAAAGPSAGYLGHPKPSLQGPVMYDVKLGRAIALNPQGQFDRTMLSDDEREFVLNHGFNSGVLVPLRSASGVGLLVYRRIRFSGIEHLRLAAEIGERVEAGFDYRNLIHTAQSVAVDQQRLALARDLHDSVSQAFSGARFWITSLRGRLTKEPEIADDLDRLGKMLGAEQEQVQDLITALRARNPHFGEADWQSEMRFIVDRLVSSWNIEIVLTLAGDFTVLPRRTVYNLAQLVREAVANAVRHGQANEITISCQKLDQQLELTVVDNGKGFQSLDARPQSLSTRLKEMGGQLDLSRKSESTMLVMKIPLGED